MTDLIVTVHPGSDIDAVADRLAKAGFQVKDKLEAVGSIIGSAPDQHIPLLRNVPGVADINESLPVQLNPPGTPH